MTRPNKRAATLGYPYRRRQMEVRVRTERVRMRRHNDVSAMIRVPFIHLAFGAGEAVRAFNRLPAKMQAAALAISKGAGT